MENMLCFGRACKPHTADNQINVIYANCRKIYLCRILPYQEALS